jgi:hypothetical protein
MNADHTDQKKQIVKRPSFTFLFDLSHPLNLWPNFFAWVGF